MTIPTHTAAVHSLPVVVIAGEPLSSADIRALARGTATAQLGPEVLGRVAAWAAHAEAVAATRPVYGRSTGVGANRQVAVADPAAQAMRLVRSHATSAGPLRARERVRALLAVRLNQLAAGGNGVAPTVVGALATMLAADALPSVRQWGGIGTGDLSALATTALALTGELPATRPVPQTVAFGPGDALAFLSSNAATLADAALAVAELRDLVSASLVVAALTCTAVRGNPEAFAPVVEAASPFPGAVAVCRQLRALLDDEAGTAPARIQDPFGLRTLPQVAGVLLDALDQAESVIKAMSAAPSENPALHPDLGVAHHGGFHAAALGQALDALTLAVARAGQLAFSRLTMLAEPDLTGDEPFLSDGAPGSSGTMVLEYAAAAALGDLRALAVPAGLQTVTLSRGLEDGASYASLSAGQAFDAIAPLRSIVAAELLCAARLLGSEASVPAALRPALNAATDAMPRLDDRADRDLTGDLQALDDLIATGRLG
ncbi:MAG: aromatic amino acid lyase [Nostocoides sp.]